MILEEYYLSEDNNIDRACEDTELSYDIIVEMVGHFSKVSRRHGQLRGKVVRKINRKGIEVLEIRHHFINKLYWSSND